MMTRVRKPGWKPAKTFLPGDVVEGRKSIDEGLFALISGPEATLRAYV
jgi:hypothetical protein